MMTGSARCMMSGKGMLPAGLVHALSQLPDGVLFAAQAALQGPHSGLGCLHLS